MDRCLEEHPCYICYICYIGRKASVRAENHVASRLLHVATSPEPDAAAADEPHAVRHVATRSKPPATSKTAVFWGSQGHVANVADVADPLSHGTVPANDHYGPNDVVADLRALFQDDGLASQAAAERLAKVRTAAGPVGDDLPAWQGWMNGRYAYQRRCGFSRAEARSIVWGEAEWEWHKRHGARPDPSRCAGYGQRLAAGEGLRLLDGAVVHVGDPEQVECLAIYGAQYRGAASVGLMAIGLKRPQP